MNIYEEIQHLNSDLSNKIALSIRLQDSSERSYTYDQMFSEISNFQIILEQAQITPGKRVAIIAESCPEWTIAFLAIQKCKATAVLLDASLDEEELLALIEHAEVCGIFATPASFSKIETISTIPIFQILEHGTPFEYHDQITTNLNPYEENADISSIIFSSGTTKKAAGIMHTHDSLLLSAKGCLESNHLKREDRFLAILPNSHIYGLICQLVGPLMLGSTTCFLESLSGESLVGAFREFQPTIFPAVPKVYELLKTQLLKKINSVEKTAKLFQTFFPRCLKLRQKTGLNLGKKLFKTIHQGFGGQLRIVCSAGAPISNDTAEFFYGIGFDMLITYGATETCIPTIGNRDKNITTNTCGKPYPNVLVKTSTQGELLLKSPYMMLGYFKDHKATSDAFDCDGWFRSGDLAQIDGCGNVSILGRCKENIVLATGKKIAPDDIEVAYMGINGIKDLVICGIPISDGTYDEVHAFVVPEPTRNEEILASLHARSKTLSHNLKLLGIHFLDEIPKTALQKPKRYLLKNMIHNKSKTEPGSICGNADHNTTITADVNIEMLVSESVAHISRTSLEDLLPNTKILCELPIDSLSTIELACEIEARCGVKIDSVLHKDLTLAELISFVKNPTQQDVITPTNLFPKTKNHFDYHVFRFARIALLFFYRVKVKNDNVLPENSGYIICANHVSSFDYLYVAFNFSRDRFFKFCCMAKKELCCTTFLSKWIGKIAGMIPVDRGDTVHESMTAIKEKLKEQWGILIHPEGTRSKDGQLGDFKKGAAVLAIDADVPIVPAYIKGGYEIYPKGQKLPHLFNWKKMHKYQIEVIYGQPIFPENRTVDELMIEIEIAVKKLADSVAPLIANL